MKKKIHPELPPIEVIPDEEAEKVDFLVCTLADTPTPFEDNLVGNCHFCGKKVQYRWHAPRKPKRVCLECAVIQLEANK
jgi:hypothetical protein